MRTIIPLLILCVVGSLSLSAQSIYYNYGQENFLRLETNKSVSSDDFMSFFSFDAYLNGEFRVGNNNKIAVEIPFNRGSFDFGFGSFSDFGIGNISVAYQIRKLTTPSYYELKLRLPTAGAELPLLADFTERISSFIQDLFSVEGSYNFESSSVNGFYYRIKPGFKLLIFNDDAFQDTAELLVDLNLLGGYRTGMLDINVGYTTTTTITEDNIDFSDRVLRQFLATITYEAGAFQPGLIFRLPLNDALDNSNLLVGVNLAYTLGGEVSKVPNDERQ